jgi:hypothetical protein
MKKINKHGLSRVIPSDVKQQVRKRCGFGCVVCGLGIYEYEHFNPDFKYAKNHDSNGIMLLCPNHHAKKTKGSFSVESLKIFNNAPRALRQGFINEKFDLRTNNPIIRIGNCLFEKTPILIQIINEPILSILPGEDEDEPYLLSANLRDKNGNLILGIDRNEWLIPTDQWDCKIEGNKIEIRSAPRNIELVIRQEPPNTLIIERLQMMHKQSQIIAHEGKGIRILSSTKVEVLVDKVLLKNTGIGLIIDEEGNIGIAANPEYGAVIGSVNEGEAYHIGLHVHRPDGLDKKSTLPVDFQDTRRIAIFPSWQKQN